MADILLGHTPIGAVEIEPYARNILLSRQLDGRLPVMPIWDDVRTFRYDNPNTREFIRLLRGIREHLCICGGFPCQDISCAGRGEGIGGKKSGLWKEYKRIIREIRPKYVFMENSNFIVKRGLDIVLTDIAEMGYSMAWATVSASDVGAPHTRKRFWGVAISDSMRDGDRGFSCGSSMEKNTSDLSNSMHKRATGVFGIEKESDEKSKPERGGKTFNVCGEWRDFESRMVGVANRLSGWLDDCQQGTLWTTDEKGIPRITKTAENRASRMKAIGNAQVPLCAAVAFTLLKTFVDNFDKSLK